MCLSDCEFYGGKVKGLIVVTQQSVHVFYPDLN